MWNAFRMLIRPVIKPIVRPIVRFLVGLIAIPLFRLFLKKVVRLQELDAELEKDLEQWFRASLVLLVATRNMEETLFPFLEGFRLGDEIGMGFRIMLAIGVVEMMPDQELFAIIHPGPPRIEVKQGLWKELREKWWEILRGIICQHLNRSSPVFAILAAIVSGSIGWLCYGIAIAQYLIIGLVTSKDKAMDVLSEFDRQVAHRRRELVEEFEFGESPDRTPRPGPAPQAKPAEEAPPPDDADSSDDGEEQPRAG